MDKYCLMMENFKKEFLLAEYSAILEHSRTHQNTRFNVTLFSIAGLGALMLNCFKEDDTVRITSLIIQHLLVLIMVILDIVFINRLKEYFTRIIEIENEFGIEAFFTQRRKNLKDYHKGATSTILKHIFYLLFSINFLYSTLVLYKSQKFLCDSFDIRLQVLNWIWVLFFLILNAGQFIWVRNKLNVKKILVDVKWKIPAPQSDER